MKCKNCGHRQDQHFPDPPTTQTTVVGTGPDKVVLSTGYQNRCKVCNCQQFVPKQQNVTSTA